jgi:hypothetical protein
VAQAQYGKKKIPNTKRARGVAQVAEHLLSKWKCKILSSKTIISKFKNATGWPLMTHTCNPRGEGEILPPGQPGLCLSSEIHESINRGPGCLGYKLEGLLKKKPIGRP